MTNASIQGVLCLVSITSILIMLKQTGDIQLPWLYVFAPLWEAAIAFSIVAIITAFLGLETR